MSFKSDFALFRERSKLNFSFSRWSWRDFNSSLIHAMRCSSCIQALTFWSNSLSLSLINPARLLNSIFLLSESSFANLTVCLNLPSLALKFSFPDFNSASFTSNADIRSRNFSLSSSNSLRSCSNASDAELSSSSAVRISSPFVCKSLKLSWNLIRSDSSFWVFNDVDSSCSFTLSILSFNIRSLSLISFAFVSSISSFSKRLSCAIVISFLSISSSFASLSNVFCLIFDSSRYSCTSLTLRFISCFWWCICSSQNILSWCNVSFFFSSDCSNVLIRVSLWVKSFITQFALHSISCVTWIRSLHNTSISLNSFCFDCILWSNWSIYCFCVFTFCSYSLRFDFTTCNSFSWIDTFFWIWICCCWYSICCCCSNDSFSSLVWFIWWMRVWCCCWMETCFCVWWDMVWMYVGICFWVIWSIICMIWIIDLDIVSTLFSFSFSSSSSLGMSFHSIILWFTEAPLPLASPSWSCSLSRDCISFIPSTTNLTCVYKDDLHALNSVTRVWLSFDKRCNSWFCCIICFSCLSRMLHDWSNAFWSEWMFMWMTSASTSWSCSISYLLELMRVFEFIACCCW